MDQSGGTIRQRGVKTEKSRKRLLKLLDDYTDYKNTFAKKIQFDPKLFNLSKYIKYYPSLLIFSSKLPRQSPPP